MYHLCVLQEKVLRLHLHLFNYAVGRDYQKSMYNLFLLLQITLHQYNHKKFEETNAFLFWPNIPRPIFFLIILFYYLHSHMTQACINAYKNAHIHAYMHIYRGGGEKNTKHQPRGTPFAGDNNRNKRSWLEALMQEGQALKDPFYIQNL